MWERSDNQEVGLEAATLQRKRNSSLVKRTCAKNVTGLKHDTEATGFKQRRKPLFDSVGEHSKDCEAGLQGPVECLEEIMQA
jgi:hypothetical protein